MTEPPTPEILERGRRVFATPAKFVMGVAAISQLPLSPLTELAIAGRSNVGKSSLINALTNQKDLARASNTPGRTRELNFFNIADTLHLVDMPGYGYAKASKGDIKKWQTLLRAYLRGRTTLKRAYVLIDSRHGVLKADQEMFEMLDECAVTYQIVMTKADKPGSAELGRVIDATAAIIKTRAAAFPQFHVTSSLTGFGIDVLRADMVRLADEDAANASTIA